MSSGKSDEDEYDSSNHSAESEPTSLDHNQKLAGKRLAGRQGPAAKGLVGKKRAGNSQDGGQQQGGVPALSIGPNGSIQYQTSNGLVSVLTPFNLGGGGNNGNQSSSGVGHGVDMGSLGGTTVIMTQDGQQYLIPVNLGADGQIQSGQASSQQLMKQQHNSSMNSNSSSGSSSANILSSSNNLGGTQQVMAEEVGRKRETRLLKNREAAKECRRKKKEYIKCLENRVAVLENQNKALIEELKSLKELYCKSTTHD